MNKSTLKTIMSELGRRGGASKSDAKREAVRKSLAEARASRWPDRKPVADLDAVAGSQAGKAASQRGK